MKVDIIILSYCADDSIFQMNQRCISSLVDSEDDYEFNIILMESNKAFDQSYETHGANLEIIIPQEDFNFNRFLNIGFKQCQSEFIAFCNNDIVFHNGWFSEIHKVSNSNKDILSFCPLDPTSKWTSIEEFKQQEYSIGYGIRREFVGWCYILKREVFDIISEFDEQFSFYFQDDDFALTLRKFNIKHALIPHSQVEHTGAESSTKVDGFGYNERANKDRVMFHNKWGSQRMIAMKNRICNLLRLLKLGGLSRYIY